MKRILLVFVLATLALANPAHLRAASDPNAEFGMAIVKCLKSGQMDGFFALLISPETLRPLMVELGEDAERIGQVMAKLEADLPEMKQQMVRAMDYVRDDLFRDTSLKKAKFLKTELQEDSNHPKLNRRDVYVVFKLGKKSWVFDADDCILTQSGWRLTGKFNIQPYPRTCGVG